MNPAHPPLDGWQDRPPLKLDVDRIPGLTPGERALALVVAEETERQREAEREARGTTTLGLLGTRVDYVDTLPWDEWLESPDVLDACRLRTNVTEAEILDFARSKLHPTSRRAIFWAARFYEQLRRDFVADAVKVIEATEKRLKQEQADARRAQAVRAAEARHSKKGGYRDKADQVRAEWSTGKYKSRDKCADAVHERLSLSRKAARNALIGAPDPI